MTDELSRTAFERIAASHPWLVRVRPAAEVVPGLAPNLILHAAPPTRWAEMGDLLRGGMIGAALFEGLARTPEEAVARAESGEIRFAAAQDHGGMAGGVGSLTASMPVMVVEDRSTGARSTHNLMEGLGRTLVSGAYDGEVLSRLAWFRDELGPTLDRALAALGGIDLRELIAEALTRGDELHNRNRAATSLLVNHLTLGMLEAGIQPAEQLRALRFVAGNPQFFVGAVLPAAKLMLSAAHGIAGCSIVTALGANGRDCGLQLSGTGESWFIAPGETPTGVLQPGAFADEVAPGCGDSFVAELAGFGASVLPAAPALCPVIGVGLGDAERFAENAYTLAVGEHPYYRVPALGFRGIPIGFDARRIVHMGIRPVIDIMMCHRRPGIGLVGMGTVSAPLSCFQDALAALDGTNHT